MEAVELVPDEAPTYEGLPLISGRLFRTPPKDDPPLPPHSSPAFNYLLSQEDARDEPAPAATLRHAQAQSAWVQGPARASNPSGWARGLESALLSAPFPARPEPAVTTTTSLAGQPQSEPRKSAAPVWRRGGQPTAVPFDQFRQSPIAQPIVRSAASQPSAALEHGVRAASCAPPRASCCDGLAPAGSAPAGFSTGGGFLTARGGVVHVSEASLSRSAALLAECEAELALEHPEMLEPAAPASAAPAEPARLPPQLPPPPPPLLPPAAAQRALPSAQGAVHASWQPPPSACAQPACAPARSFAQRQPRQGLAAPPPRTPQPLGVRALQPAPTEPHGSAGAKLSGRGRPFVPPATVCKQPRLHEQAEPPQLEPRSAARPQPARAQPAPRTPAGGAASSEGGGLPNLFDLSAHAARPRRSLRELRDAYGPHADVAVGVASAALRAPSPAEPGGAGGAARATAEQLLAQLRAEGARLADGEEGLGWVRRHLAHVEIKLAAYERAFPRLEGLALTPPRVRAQLRYRYQREVVCNHRSALQRLLEGDTHAARLMVLLVSAVQPALAAGAPPRVELSDGWHSMAADLDPALARLLHGGKLGVGAKLALCGCRLSSAQAGGPQQLALHANGARLARWDAPLGLQPAGRALRLRLDSLVADGGSAPAVRVVVQRHYPVQYLLTTPDGKRVHSARLEAHDAERTAEAFAAALEAWTGALRDAAERSALSLAELHAQDAGTLCARLDDAQAAPDLAALVLALLAKDRETAARQLAQLDDTQQAALRAACGGRAPPALLAAERRSQALCRLALGGLRADGSPDGCVCELTVWNPPEHLLDGAGCLEGSCWQLSFLEAHDLRGAPALRLVAAAPAEQPALARPLPFALKASKLTTWTRLAPRPAAFLPRAPLPFAALGTLRPGDEFCAVGVLLQTSAPFEWRRGEACFHAFCAQPLSSELLCVRVRADAHWLSRAPPFALVALTDVRYVEHDALHGTHVASAEDHSPTAQSCAPLYARAALNALGAQLGAQPALRQHLEALSVHARKLLNGEFSLPPRSTPEPAPPPAVAEAAQQQPSERAPDGETRECVLCGASLPAAELEQHMQSCGCMSQF